MHRDDDLTLDCGRNGSLRGKRCAFSWWLNGGLMVFNQQNAGVLMIINDY